MLSQVEFLDRYQVAELLSCNPSSVDRLWRQGRLPAPMKVGERLLRWDRAELIAAIKERTASTATATR